jgi:hypothetical protein
MLAFLMDHHIRAEITEGLRQRGIDVLTAFDDGSSRIDDSHLLARATELDRVLVSQDKDLLVIAAKWQQMGGDFAGLVYTAEQDSDIGGTIEYLELVARLLEPHEIRNRVEFIPTRR